MKPSLCVEHGNSSWGPFGAPPLGSDERMHVGYISNDIDYPNSPAHVYQAGMSRYWCASLWDHPPSRELWQSRSSRERLLTYVLCDNLNFHNTPFEHRFNLFDSWGDRPDLEILAKMEMKLWGWALESFIPFKRPLPGGYKGVWGDFGHWSGEMNSVTTNTNALFVNDALEYGRHLLEFGWWA